MVPAGNGSRTTRVRQLVSIFQTLGRPIRAALPPCLAGSPRGWWIENALRRATFLDVILYSREQIQKETAAKGLDPDDNESAPWGIISVKAQSVDYELPMQPITMMRNALGKEEGGSGVPLVREEYKKSVAFWTEHAPIK